MQRKSYVAPSLLVLGIGLAMGVVVACDDDNLFSELTELDGGAKDGGKPPTTPPSDSGGGDELQYTVSGTISGLSGNGLVLSNGSDKLAIRSDATSFSFKTKLKAGDAYAVTAEKQPTQPSQTCTVTNGAGTASGNVTNIAVVCTTNTYAISVNAAGVLGTGLVLQNNAGDDLAIEAGAEAATFATKIASGANFAVTIKTQPSNPAQSCEIAGGSGTVVAGDVRSITVNCTNIYTVSGTVSGLAGSGLVLQNNGGDDVPISANGGFAFSTPVGQGQPYAVTVKSGSNPSNPWQTCTVDSASGTVTTDVSDVVVTCVTTPHTVKGLVTGLTGSGLVLTNNGADDTSPNPDGTFAFATTVLSGASYDVQVKTSPTNPWQTCSVSNGTGTIADADIDVAVTCQTSNFNVSGKVVGLRGTGLVATFNGTPMPTFNTNDSFSFNLASGSPYTFAITTQPSSPPQTCRVVNGSGTVQGADITNVRISCLVVMVIYATGEPGWNADVIAKLAGINAFSDVLTYDANAGTPSVAELQAADTILVYSDSGFAAATLLGDRLADFFDAGGRVTVATFANASVPLAGRWETGNYQLIAPTGQTQGDNISGPVLIDEPGSPLVDGVTTLNSPSAYRSTGAPINGGVVVARWNNGAPLLVRGVKNGRNFASVNMYPPSADARPDFWTGSGAEILRNAMIYE